MSLSVPEDAATKLLPRSVAIIVVAVVCVATGLWWWCGFSGQNSPLATSTIATVAATTPVVASTPTPVIDPLDGAVVVLDPGHNGRNSANPRTISAAVPDGRGGEKACNTSGASTASGYAEHEFAWDVAQRTKAVLEARGATVYLTRADNDGIGPCVDERGKSAAAHSADVLVSIHGDGSEDRSLSGFFVIVSSPPLNTAQGAPSTALATYMVTALTKRGFTVNPSVTNGISRRSDLATLSLSTRPVVLVELGEMRNRDDAAVMESAEGRQRYALALTSGLSAWFTVNPPANTVTGN